MQIWRGHMAFTNTPIILEKPISQHTSNRHFVFSKFDEVELRCAICYDIERTDVKVSGWDCEEEAEDNITDWDGENIFLMKAVSPYSRYSIPTDGIAPGRRLQRFFQLWEKITNRPWHLSAVKKGIKYH
ncbi:hypothetical protein MFLAVUS_008950 [Mucor flavus]|uniref:Uncharacterized protein n=1 Tax=Mucor flavus TaxID=439312 RepID=A0ABP9Z8I3_9FUNG